MTTLQTHEFDATGTATISPCGTYRYTLTRLIYQTLRLVKPCLFIMLNPSIADARQNDPTIRRCLGFAKGWGCTSLTVVNLFAYRATDPAEMSKAAAQGLDIIGPDNESYIHQQVTAHHTGVTIAAWGAHPLAHRRARAIEDMLGYSQILKLTKDGWPCHPLYLKGDLRPQPWSVPV